MKTRGGTLPNGRIQFKTVNCRAFIGPVQFFHAGAREAVVDSGPGRR